MKAIFSITLILFLSFNLHAAQDDYQFICNTFKKNINKLNADPLTKEALLKNINETIWNNIKTKEAKEIMSVVASVSPDKKYILFKNAVEIVTQKKWDCPAMRDF